MAVTLNVDLGELPDEPEELYALAHVVNVACGGHAGDDASMKNAVRLAKAGGATVLAHPSYVDREGFGRKKLDVDAVKLEAEVFGQIGSLVAVAAMADVTVRGAKAHGALYHAASTDAAIAEAVVGGIVAALGEGDVVIAGPAGSELARAAAKRNVRFVREGFADRAYRADGTLVPRGETGALLVDPAECAEQARRLVASGAFDTLCVHGDTPGSVAIARAVRAVLDGAP